MVDPRGTCAYELGVIPQVTGNGVFDGNTLHPEDIYHMGMKEVPAGPFDMRGTRVRWLFGPIDYKGRVARTVREEHHGSSSRKRTHIGTKLPLFELNIV